MAEFGVELAAEILAAAEAGASETSEALSRTFDAKIEMGPGESNTLDWESPPEGLDGPGLLVLLKVGDQAALTIFSESTGVLPEWYAKPDATGTSKLQTLAQELGMLLLPESHMPEDFGAERVENVAESLKRGEVSTGAGFVSFELKWGDDKTGPMHLVWPAMKPGEVFAAAESEEAAAESADSEPTAAEPEVSEPSSVKETPAAVAASQEPRHHLEELPSYSRSLLRIKVPVVVSLAQQTQPIHRILEIGTGSIIQFDKSCEELLELDVAGQKVAEGEAVKVGDKFGLRITSVLLPDERFRKESGPGG